MPTIQIYLTPEQDKLIQSISKEKEVTKVDVVQKIINDNLIKHKSSKN